jgi:MscS family membrane protein
MMIRRIIQSSIVVLSFAFLLLYAQAPASSDSLGRSTPRGAVIGFLTAAHKGDWTNATQYLDNVKGEDAVELATQLSIVLDQGLPAADLDALSDKPEGNLKDSLPPSQELAGTIPTNGGPLHVTLERTRRGPQIVWLFSSNALKEVPAVYQEFSSSWIPDYIPHPLLHRGWLGVPLWQWIVLAVGVAMALLIAAAMRRIAVPLLRRLFPAFSEAQDEWLLARPVGPLRGLISLLVLEATISSLRLPLFARQVWYYTGGALAIILGGWLFTRVVQVSGLLLNRSVQRRGGADATAVIRLCQRTLSVLTFAIVVVLLLKGVGLIKDVSTLVAGLGVGGIAVALAAQKTLENLFGGISIIFDKTIRVGDYCRIGDQKGSVEDIGLRSTLLRTDANTVLTVPNSKLSAMDVENFGMRKKIYFHHIIGLRRETTAGQLRALLDALRQLLTADAQIEPGFYVRLIRFSPSSLDIEIAAYVLTVDGAQFLGAQEDLLLRIMDTIEAAGTSIAFPSQTLYLGREKPLPTADSPPSAEPSH